MKRLQATLLSGILMNKIAFIRRYSALLLLLVLTTSAFAQKEGYNWYFGSRSGLTWNTTRSITIGGVTLDNMPNLLSGSQMDQHEGVFNISDKDGNLLFYSDGVTVWNRQHQVMLNGTGLFGHISSAQSGIVIPHPDPSKSHQYITLSMSLHPDVMTYSV